MRDYLAVKVRYRLDSNAVRSSYRAIKNAPQKSDENSS